MRESPHIADRPTWNCRACGKPWPCRMARMDLAIEHQETPTSLALYLAAQWHEASRDLTGNEGDSQLLERFLGWHRAARAVYGRHQAGPLEILKLPDDAMPAHKIAGEETYLAVSPAEGAER